MRTQKPMAQVRFPSESIFLFFMASLINKPALKIQTTDFRHEIQNKKYRKDPTGSNRPPGAETMEIVKFVLQSLIQNLTD